jgi:hypothetical protein
VYSGRTLINGINARWVCVPRAPAHVRHGKRDLGVGRFERDAASDGQHEEGGGNGVHYLQVLDPMVVNYAWKCAARSPELVLQAYVCCLLVPF